MWQNDSLTVWHNFNLTAFAKQNPWGRAAIASIWIFWSCGNSEKKKLIQAEKQAFSLRLSCCFKDIQIYTYIYMYNWGFCLISTVMSYTNLAAAAQNLFLIQTFQSKETGWFHRASNKWESSSWRTNKLSPHWQHFSQLQMITQLSIGQHLQWHSRKTKIKLAECTWNKENNSEKSWPAKRIHAKLTDVDGDRKNSLM